MKGIMKRVFCFLLVAALAIPTVCFNTKVSAAALPALNKKSKTLTGIGTMYTLKVKRQPANTRLSWKSSDSKIVTVDGLGQVTAKKKGKAVVTCTITYSDKSVMKLDCDFTVKVPATDVKISNAKLKNNAHEMIVGEKYDFNRSLTPKGSSDKSYWYIKDQDIATVDKNGVVTALKEGTTQLEVRSGASKKAAEDRLNDVTHAINISITAPVAEVTNVVKSGDNQLTITFSHEMSRGSLINASGRLNTGNIRLEGKKIDNKDAADLGDITPALSLDGKTLTLTAKNKFDGYYELKIENDATTVAGIAFKGYETEFDFRDNVKPTMLDARVDETGVIAVFKFNKEINIAGLQASVDTTSISDLTKNILITPANYKLSADKKSIQLDLSGISSSDFNKDIIVRLTGINDVKGNPCEPYVNVAYLHPDNIPNKPNAVLLKVERTSQNKLTATFDKSIRVPGYLTWSNSSTYGMVDPEDKTKVHYTFNGGFGNNNSYLNVTLNGWQSYNCTSTSPSVTYTVDMTSGAMPPVLKDSKLVTTTNNATLVNSIVLTYDKKVTLYDNSKSGILTAQYRDNNSNVSATTLMYAATVAEDTVTLVIDPKTPIGAGVYTITLPAFFVYDSFDNHSQSVTITIAPTVDSTMRFPAPVDIKQSEENPNEFYVTFPKKVDIASAQVPTNYRVDNVFPYSAVVTSNSDSGAVVKLNFNPGTITMTASLPFYVTNITGYNNTYKPMDSYFTYVAVKENVAPIMLSCELQGSTIIMKFKEQIQGTAAFDVYSNGSLVSLNTSKSCEIAGDMVIITLAQAVSTYGLYVTPKPGCVITDLAKNPAILATQIPVTSKY